VRAGRVASRRRLGGDGGRRAREVGIERRRENERMVSGSRALSIGSLGHSYASAAGTITRKPHLLRKMRRVASVSNL
jgi:hypothetical protein